MKINLFDTNALIGHGNTHFNMHWPVPGIEYVREMDWDGITVFTDEMCFSPIVDEVKSKFKIAWAVESPVIKPHVYANIRAVEDKFDYVYISNPEAYGNPEKYKQCYFGACWIPESHCKIYEKTKLLSIVASNKTFAPGHQLRHELITRKMHPELELWGSGYKWFEDDPDGRVSPFKDYRYVIVAENCQYPGYFTDKIIDCFAAGCIPIYWGNPLMGKLFDPKGFYQWNTLEELQVILDNISDEDYDSKEEAIKENYGRFREFASPDRWMLENCYKNILDIEV